MTTTEEQISKKLDKIKWQLCELFESQDDIAMAIDKKLETAKELEKQLSFTHEHPYNPKSESIILCRYTQYVS